MERNDNDLKNIHTKTNLKKVVLHNREKFPFVSNFVF